MSVPTSALDPRVGIPAPKVPVVGSDRADVMRLLHSAVQAAGVRLGFST